MKKVYLDNAATTQLDPIVVQEMSKILFEDYGNPSSSHSFGRHAKNILELSRKSVAKLLNASAQEIIFTSCGTEANNWIIYSAIRDLKVQRIITSKIEHHAVLHSVEKAKKEFSIAVDYVKILPTGAIDLKHLADLLVSNAPTLVSLMHVNNETGTILDLERVGIICKAHNAYFHSDTVQSVGKIVFDLQQIPVDFIVASAHKFHGPKGIGFAYIKKGIPINPIIVGGEQEKGLRAGTESLHNIVGLAKALELSYQNLEVYQKTITELKTYCLDQLRHYFPGTIVNGQDTFYNIINVTLSFAEEKAAMILFNLDMKGIAVSRGSACQSGSNKPSHVLAEMLSPEELKKPYLRISFSHFNSKEDIDVLIEALKGI